MVAVSDRQVRPREGVWLPRVLARAFSGVGIGRCDDRCDPVCVLSSCLPCGGAAQSGKSPGCGWLLCMVGWRFGSVGFGLGDRAAGSRAREGHSVDALAPGGDEGRGTLRKATGSREQALIRGYPNGATHPARGIIL